MLEPIAIAEWDSKMQQYGAGAAGGQTFAGATGFHAEATTELNGLDTRSLLIERVAVRRSAANSS